MSVGIQLLLLSSSQSLLPSPCRFTILQSSVAPTSVEYYTSFVTMYDDQKGILKFLVVLFFGGELWVVSSGLEVGFCLQSPVTRLGTRRRGFVIEYCKLSCKLPWGYISLEYSRIRIYEENLARNVWSCTTFQQEMNYDVMRDDGCRVLD